MVPGSNSPEIILRQALAASPLNKDYMLFASDADYQEKMNRMVSRDQIPRLGEGWMVWAGRQASEWELMEAQAKHDEEAVQSRLADQPRGSNQ